MKHSLKHLQFALLLLAIFTTTNAVKAQSNNQSNLQAGKNNVEFKSEGLKIKGHLFLPPDYTPEGQFPAIVVVAPASGIKEQTAGIYAERLAKAQYITLAFDHRTFGESDGEPRAMETASKSRPTSGA